MATALSLLTDPNHQLPTRHDGAQLVASLAHGDAPWCSRDWLESVGALPPAFAPSARCDVEEAFCELFAATGMDFCYGASVTFYSSVDDTVHLTSWTEAKDTTYFSDWIHELVHATGHVSRLGRQLPSAFGQNVDAEEDLVAEIGAAIACLDLGYQPRLRHPELLGAWIDLLQTHQQALPDAVRRGRDAASYLFQCRNVQLVAFEQWNAAERAREQAEEAGWAAARRLELLRQREGWALRCATGSRPGERVATAIKCEAAQRAA